MPIIANLTLRDAKFGFDYVKELIQILDTSFANGDYEVQVATNAMITRGFTAEHLNEWLASETKLYRIEIVQVVPIVLKENYWLLIEMLHISLREYNFKDLVKGE